MPDHVIGDEFLRFGNIAQAYQSLLFGIVLWDWLVCARSEYKHIWLAQHSLAKYLYLVSRYLTLGLTAAVFALHFVERPLSECNVMVRVNCAALTVVQMASTAVLSQRAYILSQRNKTILVILGSAILSILVLGICHATVGVQADASAMIDGKGACLPATRPGGTALSTIFFLVPIVANSFATAVIINRAREYLTKATSLRNILLVDGTLFIIGVDAVGLLQLIFFLATMCGVLMMLNASALLALTSVFSCRLILHLRQEAENVHEQSADRPVDWTNGFGKPNTSEKSQTKRLLFPSRSMSSRRKGSKDSQTGETDFYGCTSFEDLPDFNIEAVVPPEPWMQTQRLPVRVSLETHQRVEEMTKSERDWEKEHPLDRHRDSITPID